MIQRYGCYTVLSLNDDGDYVLYVDHAAEVKALREALEACDQAFGRINLGQLSTRGAAEIWQAQQKAHAALEK